MLTLFTIEEKENSVFRRKFLRNLPVNSLKIEKREFTSVDEDGNRDVFAKNFTVFAGFSQPDARSEELTGNKCVKVSVKI